ncbi:MAG: hypothetical protein AB2L14_25740 [Candidatus Xenobiia bacterium LiM19]
MPFSLLQSKSGKSSPFRTDSRSYLAGLPESETAAREVLAWGEEHFGELSGPYLIAPAVITTTSSTQAPKSRSLSSVSGRSNAVSPSRRARCSPADGLSASR